jgi:hypothetical protein
MVFDFKNNFFSIVVIYIYFNNFQALEQYILMKKRCIPMCIYCKSVEILLF